MFLYIKDFFQKRIFHILLILFCGIIMFHSIMTLVDLKNYEVVIDYSEHSNYHQSSDSDGKKRITFERPNVKVNYKYADMPYKFTWVSGQLLKKNLSIENFTIEYKVYSGLSDNDLIDNFTITYENFSSDIVPIQREYEKVYAVILDVVGYDITFNAWVYLPHIFVIAGCLFFIVPSAAMLFQSKKEEK